MRKADNLITILRHCHEIWEPKTSWNPLGHSRPVTGLIDPYLLTPLYYAARFISYLFSRETWFYPIRIKFCNGAGGGWSGSAAVVCSSGISDRVTWYTAELTSAAKCLAYFYPFIGLR